MYSHVIEKKGWLHDMLRFYCHHRYDEIDAKQFARQKPYRTNPCKEGRNPLDQLCIKRLVDICPGRNFDFFVINLINNVHAI